MPSIKKNFAYSMFYELLAMAIPLVTAPYLSRVLGPDGMGEYSLSYNIAYYFVMVALLGMYRYGTRTIASLRSNDDGKTKVFWELFFVQLITSGAATVCYCLFGLAFSDGYLFALWIPYLLSTACDITWLFRGEENFKVTVIRNSLIKLITAVCIFAFVKASDHVSRYVLIMSFGYFASQIALWPFLRSHVSAFVMPRFSKVIRHLKPSIVLFVPLIATSIYRVFDKVLIGVLSTNSQLGYFDSADKIVMVPLGVIGALGAVMLPRMSFLISDGKKERSFALLRLSMLLSMTFSIGLAFGIASVSDVFSVAYFGEAFAPVGAILGALSITVPFIAWANVIREQYLIPSKKDREYLVSVLLGAVVNVSLNIIAIPSFGAMGAVCVTLLTEAVVCCSLSFFARRQLPLIRFLKDSFPLLLSGMALFVAVRASNLFAGNFGLLLRLCLEIGVGLVVYLICCVVIYKISESRRALFNQMLPVSVIRFLERRT